MACNAASFRQNFRLEDLKKQAQFGHVGFSQATWAAEEPTRPTTTRYNVRATLARAMDLEKQRDEMIEIAARHGARNVRVFGSVARGEAGSESDIDLLVELEADRSFLDLVGLGQDLDELLQRKVDVLTDASLHPRVRQQILAEARPL